MSSATHVKQANADSGIVEWSLGFNLFTLDFYTLSVAGQRQPARCVREGEHLTSLTEFEHDMRWSITFVHYKLLGRDVPTTWKDALERLRQHDATQRPLECRRSHS